jgi:hypothetical protein
MNMRNPTFKYGDMTSQWNRPGTAFIVDPVGSVIRYLVLQPIARRVAEKLRQEKEPYNLLLFDPEHLREQFARGGASLMCWFGMMQSHTMSVLQAAVESLQVMAEDDPRTAFNVEFPGRHRIADAHVLQVVKHLPGNVTFWRPKNEAPRAGG